MKSFSKHKTANTEHFKIFANHMSQPRFKFVRYATKQTLTQESLNDPHLEPDYKDSFDHKYITKGHGEISTEEPDYTVHRPCSVTIPLFPGNNTIQLLHWFGRKEVEPHVVFDHPCSGVIRFLKHTKDFQPFIIPQVSFTHHLVFEKQSDVLLKGCSSLFVSYKDGFTSLIVYLEFTENHSSCSLVLKRKPSIKYEKKLVLLPNDRF